MLHRLARIFSIPAGEERRTFLLFLMYLLFFIGLRWGDSAGRTLFQLSWGDLLSVIFLISAPLALMIGLTYSYFANRVSNERLLTIILGLMIAWLISVQILLVADIGTGPQGFTYLYFFLGTLAAADVAALHLLNYINDFYNTRSAKLALPFILSASIAGSVVAGFSAPFLNGLIGLTFMPLAWIACLAGILLVARFARRTMPPELVQLEQQRQTQRKRTNVFKDLRNDARLLNKLDILRWLAVSTLVLVLLMKLLTIQSASVFNQIYAGDPKGLFNVYNLLDAAASLIGLIFSSLIFNRLIVRYGVGSMSLVFPALTIVIVAGINFLPTLGVLVASLAYLDDRAFKKVFRNPVEAMLYNSVPLNIKARARAFINSMTLPLGSLLAGLLGLAMAKGGLISPLAGALLCFMLALFYLGISWLVKNAYSRAMIRLVATDELAIFRAGYGEQEEFDPLLVRRLAQRLRGGEDNGDTTVILAEMLYDFQGRVAIHDLINVAERRGGAVRASVIQLLADWIEEDAVRQLCLTGLRDEDVRVRRAAASVLATVPNAAQDRELIGHFLEVIQQPDETTQSHALPVLIASGDAQGAAVSMKILSGWVGDAYNARRRALGLQVLAQTHDARLLDQIEPYLQDRSSIVRVQAVEVIGTLAANTLTAHTDRVELAQRGVAILRGVLHAEDIAQRLAVVNQLGVLNGAAQETIAYEAGQGLLEAMRDDRFRVRRAACRALSRPNRREVEQAYRSSDERVAECALYVMANVGSERIGGTLVQRRVLDRCEELARQWYLVQTYRAALSDPATPAVRFLSSLLHEQDTRLIDRIFWLLGAIYGEQDTLSMRRSLRSPDPRARANALESLEAIGSRRLSDLITPMFNALEPATLAQIAQEQLGLSVPATWDAFQIIWPALRDRAVETPLESSDLLTAAGMFAAIDVIPVTTHSSAAIDWLTQAVREETNSDTALTRETAELALRKLDAQAEKERTMLTMIEKVVFLKQVQFFDEVSASDLRAIAGVTETATYEAGQTIITEGEPSDALYVIVSGRVAVQHRKRAEVERTLTELASLGPREYFGEMSLFDEVASSADVVALVPTQVLLVRRAPLFALIERQPALAMDLFRVLSRRLRQANELLVKRNR
ncbi:MAG TPA: cyclic nucleotide-binding domain-containing protein [Anaerolineae bacterium]|nr:cyclic nucleotide-binding domain-containing protein [Anaerolineae bacterium]